MHNDVPDHDSRVGRALNRFHRGIGSGGSTVRVPAAGDEPVILRIVHQRHNMPTLAYVGDIDADDMDRPRVDGSLYRTCEAYLYALDKATNVGEVLMKGEPDHHSSASM